jgi:hypothetical protein
MRGPVLLLLVLMAAPAGAQQARRQVLEQRIIEQFYENFRRQAALTPDQFTRFRTVAARSLQQRRERQQRERQLWMALEEQMRPGMAANPDSVTKLMDGIVAARLANVDQLKADDREYAAFLTPVQRAQLFLAFERFQRNIEELIRRRLQGAGQPGGGGNLPEP